GSLQSKIDAARAENEKGLAGLRLELIQLMEQGDQVVKSPWSSWQFGANYMYSKWNGTYKGRGDKAQKYPFEGVFTRSNDLFLRSVSPDSELYEQYIATVADNAVHSATTSTIKRRGGSTNYGLASVIKNQEPIASIELGASVRPKKISKSPITVTPPSITVNAVTPLSTPQPPGAPQLPQITIEKFDPVAPEAITVNLPTPPTFNIKLGSYRNNMTQNVGQPDGDRIDKYGAGYSVLGSGNVSIDNNTIQVQNGAPAVIYAWGNGPTTAIPGTSHDAALLKAYFDVGGNNGTVTLVKDLTVNSINSLNAAERAAEAANGRAWNAQDFFVGGVRIATLDNATNKTIRNEANINLAGPLAVGFEIQSDTLGAGKREVINAKLITDEVESGDEYRGADGLGGLHVGNQNNPSNEKTITLSPNLGGNENPGGLKISRTPDIVDGKGRILTRGGYVGYKIGLILTFENDDSRANSDYRLINDGIIKFIGRSSIGVQIFAPGSPNTRITVQNNGTITMGGINSYGLKLSSRVSQNNMTFENNGTINISGAGGNSLSSGIAVLEDGTLKDGKSIRAYDGKVQNKGTINVSGGEGNTGMVLITKANDDITNATNKNITVTGAKNIGMRVDLGTVDTDDKAVARISPTAINNGNISITDGEQNIAMVANNSEGTATVAGETVMQHRAVAHNKSNILFNNVSKKAIGMFASKGGELINEGTIKGNSTNLQETIGMVIQPKDGTKISSATNSGTIELKGKKVVGVYNQGKFSMTGGSILTSGEKSISMYANNSSEYTKISKGSITAQGGALGLFADNTTMELGASSGTDSPTLKADGLGTLLFYNYTNNNASGKFKLNQDVSADIVNGATAFYYKDSATSALISQRLNDMFADTTGSVAGKKLKVKLDDKSTLFVLENTVPSTTTINLSSADPTNINAFLGNRVTIDSGSGAFKAYKVTKGRLSVDKDVNLDNHTGTSISEYYRVDFLNSAVKVEAGKKMYGTDAGKLKQVIAQANYDGATGTSNIDVVNDGTIDYSKKGATAIVVDYGQATNNGLIKMDAANSSTENSIGLFGASSSKLTNSATGEIQ
ncbi:autotransporter-associated N-terminal domain-containing protein, partial [Fusobacterium polymorphum]